MKSIRTSIRHSVAPMVAGGAVMIAACTSPFSSGEREMVGVIIGLDTSDPMIEVPDTVTAGESFTITMVTAWPNTCARKGETRTALEGADTVTVTPIDLISQGTGVQCGQTPQQFEHVATLVFPDSGPALVLIRGRSAFDGDAVATVERAVFVE